MLVTEFKFYRENHSRLIEKYHNKYIVIKGKKVIGVYNSHAEAYFDTKKSEELGTFLIQKISKDNIFVKSKSSRFSLFNADNIQMQRVESM